jgi:hypothetical protein
MLKQKMILRDKFKCKFDWIKEQKILVLLYKIYFNTDVKLIKIPDFLPKILLCRATKFSKIKIITFSVCPLRNHIS